MQERTRSGFIAIAAGTMLLATGVNTSHAASAAEISSSARAALRTLYASTPAAKTAGGKAKGILIFPSVYKAGFMVGAQEGDGAMFKGGKTVGYYRTAAASFGLQAGAQKFGYALFFMNDSALEYLDKSGGWEIGSGPTLVVVDKGAAKSLSSTTLTQDVYAFIFSQKGLMAGLGLQGSKITRIHPD
jgi:lipid-binding SYLF domain-containing protein